MSSIRLNKTKYPLTSKNYFEDIVKKDQIIIGNTFTSDMKHYKGWLTRISGNYTKTAPYTIDKDGKIYEHYNPKYYSDFIKIKNVSQSIIPVLMENEGWLVQETDGFYYNRHGEKYLDEVYERRWRGHTYWAKYTEKQLNSLLRLSKYLCEEFSIPLEAMYHNAKFKDIYDYRGVAFRSNYSTDYTDLNPSWEYEKFKNKLEHNGKY